MKKILKDYFSFNSRERVSILLLCCLMAFFWMLPNWYPEAKRLPESKGWRVQHADSGMILEEIAAKPVKKIIPSESAKLFEFDPNQLSAEGWEKLGLRDKTVQTILHFKEKGGRFREPEDLKKIWGLSVLEANKLIPYVRIPEKENLVVKQSEELPKTMPSSIYINQATVADLLLIPGFSKPLAARMIKFRDKMGGFKSVEQISKTYGLPDSLFQKMASIVVL
jgi:DNA uptake protein ComE-like DNA-binding protein